MPKCSHKRLTYSGNTPVGYLLCKDCGFHVSLAEVGLQSHNYSKWLEGKLAELERRIRELERKGANTDGR